MVNAKYREVLDLEKCEDCNLCLDRCPMDAILGEKAGIKSVNQDRCIGCGLCVNQCPVDAIHLEVRPKEEDYEPPKTGLDFYMKIAQMRGKPLTPLASVKQ